MKEKLIKYWTFEKMMMKRSDSVSERRTFFDHCFGALEYALYCGVASKEELEELTELWEDKWRIELEEQIYVSMC